MSKDRLADLEARVERLEALLEPKPQERGAKLTAAQRRAIRVRTAAAARAAKSVGKGKGSVSSAAVRRRLKSEAGD